MLYWTSTGTIRTRYLYLDLALHLDLGLVEGMDPWSCLHEAHACRDSASCRVVTPVLVSVFVLEYCYPLQLRHSGGRENGDLFLVLITIN